MSQLVGGVGVNQSPPAPIGMPAFALENICASTRSRSELSFAPQVAALWPTSGLTRL